MPAPLADVDRQAVKAHAIMHGIRPTAEAFNIPISTVGSWSERDPEGPWCPRNPKPVVQHRPATLQPRANNANSPVIAAKNSMSGLFARTRLNMAITADKGFRRSAKQKGEVIIAQATDLKALAGLAQAAHPELRDGNSGATLAISFNLHTGMGAPEADCSPIVVMPALEQEGT